MARAGGNGVRVTDILALDDEDALAGVTAGVRVLQDVEQTATLDLDDDVLEPDAALRPELRVLRVVPTKSFTWPSGYHNVCPNCSSGIDQRANGTPRRWGGFTSHRFDGDDDAGGKSGLSAFDSGRGKHAGVRQAIEPSRDDGPGRVPGESATPRPTAGPLGRRPAMSPALDGFLRSWPFEPWLDVGLLLPALVYPRGWHVLHRRDPWTWHGGRLAAFMGGLATLFLALASPIEPFAALLLQAHMIQHLVLMMVAPPLIWLGAPLFPVVRGVPRSVRTDWVVPLLRSRTLRRLFGRLTHPVLALPLFVGVTWLWHAPVVYETALRSSGWHTLQHLCFLGSALLFWYPVVRPHPSRPRWSPWLLFPYLILADVQNTVLSALLTFSDRVLYPHYTQIPRLGGLSALQDQSAGGVIMWVPGSLAYLLPLFVIGIKILSGERAEVPQAARPVAGRAPAALSILLPVLNSTSCRPPANGFDLLRLPVLGTFLKWRHARFTMQVPLVVLAALVILDGLFGPQVGAMNLAGVLPWIHWRGLLILGLLAAGNVFCMACPFMLPRTLARRWLPAGSAGRGRCEANGWPRACSASFSGLTRRFPSGTARGGRPGSRLATSSCRS